MRKNKLIKKIVSFLLVLSFVFSGNASTVFAENSIEPTDAAGAETVSDSIMPKLDADIIESETDGYSYFPAIMFDYNRDTMNNLTMEMVAKQIEADEEKNKAEGYAYPLDKASLRKLYPSMIFIDSTIVGDAGAEYEYTDARGNVRKAVVKASYFNAADYCSFNKNNSTHARGTAYQGLVNSELVNGLPDFSVYTADLFDTNIPSNKVSVDDNTQVMFKKTDDGYYLFDSCIYKYEKEGHNVRITDTDMKKKGQGFGYLPLGEGNYHFGMDLSVSFDMAEDGMYENKECVFEFSGDDDVWVYIDGKLALELGGMHARSDGVINFATQTVTYKNGSFKDGVYYPDGRDESFEELGLKTNDNGSHLLQVFYVERGASESNCKIKFNLPVINNEILGDFSFDKIDSYDNSPVEGAEFKLYSDVEMTKVIATATSDKNGKVVFEGIGEGQYYIKESKAPEHYEAADDSIYYKLIVSKSDNNTLRYAFLDAYDNVMLDNKILNNPIIKTYADLDKTAKLVDWTERTYEITLDANAFRAPEKYEGTNLATDANAKPDQLIGGKVTDIIDNRFELTEESLIALTSDGAIIQHDLPEYGEGTTAITWTVESLENWERKFTIRAKDCYIGGNDIPTNDPKSRVVVEGDEENPIYFPEPHVNVRIKIKAGEAFDEIFLGQSLNRYFTQDQMNTLYNEGYYNDDRDVNIYYSWDQLNMYGEVEKITGSLEEFRDYIRSLSPEDKTDYTLRICCKPKVGDKEDAALKAAAMMNVNDNDVKFTASMQVSTDAGLEYMRVNGIYHVTVISGEITVNKTYDYSFLTDLVYSQEDIEKINAQQTAIFTIYRYAEDASVTDIKYGFVKPIESYTISITESGSQKIIGLRAGMYKVVENSDWTWKYLSNVKEKSAMTPMNTIEDDGIFYLGKVNSLDENGEAISGVYDRYKTNEVSYTNKLNRDFSKIYSDTTNALNLFLN